MSTSLLYHTFGIRGYEYRKTEFIGGTTLFWIEQPRERLQCPCCGSAEVTLRGTAPRLFRSVPIGSKPVCIAFDVPRVHCTKCNVVRQVKLGFADEQVRYTRAFGRYALELTRYCTIQDVARHLGVGWDLIKDLKKRHLQRHYRQPKLGHLTHLAIDELCIGRGHQYRTLVLDLDSGAIVFVGKGKGAEALKPFWRRLNSSRAKIQAVAVDLAPAYTAAVRKHLPHAALVYDRFHLMKLFHEKLTELRRQLYNEATDRMHKNVLKGIRWLLLMNDENLDDKKGDRQRLLEALKLNESLAIAYYLKEELRLFWEQDHAFAAAQFLTRWIRKAEASGIRLLQGFAKTLALHRNGLLAWYTHPISTGPLEGTNNKIRALTRQAYGFRDQEYFLLQLYALHETRFLLVG